MLVFQSGGVYAARRARAAGGAARAKGLGGDKYGNDEEEDEEESEESAGDNTLGTKSILYSTDMIRCVDCARSLHTRAKPEAVDVREPSRKSS